MQVAQVLATCCEFLEDHLWRVRRYLAGGRGAVPVRPGLGRPGGRQGPNVVRVIVNKAASIGALYSTVGEANFKNMLNSPRLY
jgi:hypothetical protein